MNISLNYFVFRIFCPLPYFLFSRRRQRRRCSGERRRYNWKWPS